MSAVTVSPFRAASAFAWRRSPSSNRTGRPHASQPESDDRHTYVNRGLSVLPREDGALVRVAELTAAQGDVLMTRLLDGLMISLAELFARDE